MAVMGIADSQEDIDAVTQLTKVINNHLDRLHAPPNIKMSVGTMLFISAVFEQADGDDFEDALFNLRRASDKFATMAKATTRAELEQLTQVVTDGPDTYKH